MVYFFKDFILTRVFVFFIFYPTFGFQIHSHFRFKANFIRNMIYNLLLFWLYFYLMSFFYMHLFPPYVSKCINLNWQDKYFYHLRIVSLHKCKFYRIFCGNQNLHINDLQTYEAQHRSQTLVIDLRIFSFIYDLSHNRLYPLS